MENYRIPFVIKILDKVLPIFLGKEIDYQTVRKILILKFTLDSRRTPASQRAQGKPKKENKNVNVMLFNMLMFGVLGVIAAGMQVLDNMFVANTISYGMMVFMLLSVYISDYSEVLLDTKEKPFYRVLPIREKELTVAKNIHIGLYISSMAGAMLFPSLVIGGVRHGVLYALLYLLMGIGMALFCLSLAGMLYYFLLKVFSGEKLKDILNYFQVFMSIAIILAYQIIPRVLNYQQINRIGLGPNQALFLLPSAWFSAIFALVFQGQTNLFFILLFATGMMVLAAFAVLNKKLIFPQFEQQLDKLDITGIENKSLSWRKRTFCKLFSKTEAERGFMELVTIHLSRDRVLKLKLYPQLTNAVIIPMIIVISMIASGLNKVNNPMELWTKIQEIPVYLGLYLSALNSAGIYYIICQTDNENTTWIYRALPLGDWNRLIKAGIKVVLGQYLIPIFILEALVFFVLYQARIGLDIVIIFLVYLLFTNILIRIIVWHLPFSISGQVKNVGRNILAITLNLILLMGTGTFHYFVLTTTIYKVLVIFVLVGLNVLVWHFVMNKKNINCLD